MGLREIFWEIKHDLRSCSAETVYALVIITGHAEVLFLSCQQVYKVTLQVIDILVLIYLNVIPSLS